MMWSTEWANCLRALLMRFSPTSPYRRGLITTGLMRVARGLAMVRATPLHVHVRCHNIGVMTDFTHLRSTSYNRDDGVTPRLLVRHATDLGACQLFQSRATRSAQSRGLYATVYRHRLLLHHAGTSGTELDEERPTSDMHGNRTHSDTVVPYLVS